MSSGVSDGVRYLWTNGTPFPWTINVQDDPPGISFHDVSLFPSLFCTDRDGLSLYCVYLTERPPTKPAFISGSYWAAERMYDLVIDDAAVGGTYAVGACRRQTGNSWARVVKVAPADGSVVWRAEIFPTGLNNTVQLGFGVSARTVRV